MDLVTASPPGGDRSYNACLVLVYRYSKTTIFLPFHQDETAIDTAIMISNKVISDTGLSFSTAYHPQTDDLAEGVIQSLENMIKRFCPYGLDFKDSDAALELAYKT
ncbi:hypothetical protein O181_085214 [Austropuccinia psidii MF-1]|uniref:Integrase catalytic domain-containing protein n=1 Tax=Austropuccinia psidii MF-1 TaxID=1389203 RepID=A0A9Q3IMW5_9BASI|nr:hypothetical protein [Austropuccinia psidii MF-1]